MSEERDLFGDRPIQSADGDRFGRVPFATALCRALCLPRRSPSFVVAVEGGWGTGKTSILNVLEALLHEERSSPLVMRFEPWPMSGSNSLIESFLLQLASLLGRESKSAASGHIASNLLRLAQLLKPLKLVPGVEPWGTLVQTLLESTGQAGEALKQLQAFDLVRTKKEIALGIRDLDRPVVVIIDDIDRLSPPEIRQIFRLVKAVADFERVAYVLAYDPSPVRQALSFRGMYDGAAYVEKIVQVAYLLPQLDSSQLRHFLLDRVRSFIADYAINLEDFEEDWLSIALSRAGVIKALRNVRDVSRLVNRLRVSVPTTRGEVNFADILVFEAIALRFPWVIERIRSHPENFLLGSVSAGRLPGSAESSAEQEGSTETKGDFRDQLGKEDQVLLHSLLGFLFPGFAVANEALDLEEFERELRICTRSPLFRLLATGHLEGLYSAQEARLFLEKESARAGILSSRRKVGNLTDWFLYLDGFVEDCALDAPVELVQLLAQLTRAVIREEGAESALPLVRNVRAFISAVLKEGDPAAVEILYLALASNSSCLSLGAPIVLAAIDEFEKSDLLPPSQRRRSAMVYSRAVANEGGRHCLVAIREKALRPVELLGEPEAIAILLAWGRLSDKGFTEVHAFVEQFIFGSNEGLQSFVEAFLEEASLLEIPHLVPSIPEFQVLCENHPRANTFKPGLWEFFERTSAEANLPVRSIPPPPGSDPT